MEIKKLDSHIKLNRLNENLIQKPMIQVEKITFQNMLDGAPLSIQKAQDLDLFGYVEKEYQKVKDFDFKKIDLREIKKHILKL